MRLFGSLLWEATEDTKTRSFFSNDTELILKRRIRWMRSRTRRELKLISEPDTLPREAYVADDLRFEDRVHSFDTLDFDDHEVPDDEIHEVVPEQPAIGLRASTEGRQTQTQSPGPIDIPLRKDRTSTLDAPRSRNR
jgi:hypothetical protein